MTPWTRCGGGLRARLAIAWIAAATLLVPAIPAQTPAAAPKFEVASVKVSTGCGSGGGRGGPSGGGSSPERLDLKCLTVMDLVRTAYVQFADGKRRPAGPDVPISGGPAWISSERYDIEAKADGPESQEMMRGPMMQTLLEDRFKLKVHHETREIPIYALTVAKGGAKLQPAQEGKCFPRSSPPAQRPPGLFPCGVFAPSSANDGVYMYSTSVADFCAALSMVLDRDVIDKTGIAGVFDYHVEPPPPDPSSGGADGAPRPPQEARIGPPAGRASPTDALGASIFAAVQRIGLKLDATKGPGEFLVIESVQRPAAN